MVFCLYSIKIVCRFKSLSAKLWLGTALVLHTPAFSQAPGETSAEAKAPCNKSSLHFEISASAPKLLTETSDNTGIIEVRGKNRAPQRLAWHFDGHQDKTSIACYRGQLIALQVMPTAARCLISIRKNTQQGVGFPAQAVNKLLCD